MYYSDALYHCGSNVVPLAHVYFVPARVYFVLIPSHFAEAVVVHCRCEFVAYTDLVGLYQFDCNYLNEKVPDFEYPHFVHVEYLLHPEAFALDYW